MNLILEAIKSLFRKVEASRTHWDTRQTKTIELTFDGNMEGREAVQADDGLFLVKISDETPSMDEVIGAKATAYTDGEYGTATVTGDVVTPFGENLYMVFEVMFVALADVTDDSMPPLAKGVWAICEVGEDGTPAFYVASLKYDIATGELRKLPEKYLPDSVVDGVAKAQATAETAQATAETAQATAPVILISTNGDDGYNHVAMKSSTIKARLDAGQIVMIWDGYNLYIPQKYSGGYIYVGQVGTNYRIDNKGTMLPYA